VEKVAQKLWATSVSYFHQNASSKKSPNGRENSPNLITLALIKNEHRW
jgi:hypothetical protein